MQSANQQVVYVITGDTLEAAQRYVAGACLSMYSLRRFHPAASLVCACDRGIYKALHATTHPLLNLVDRLIECPDASGGPVHRSRFIKTSLRGRIAGPFVYIDADTLISGPLDELFESQTDVGFTVDGFFPASPGAFPDWLMPFYRRLGWSLTDRYSRLYDSLRRLAVFRLARTVAADCGNWDRVGPTITQSCNCRHPPFDDTVLSVFQPLRRSSRPGPPTRHSRDIVSGLAEGDGFVVRTAHQPFCGRPCRRHGAHQRLDVGWHILSTPAQGVVSAAT